MSTEATALGKVVDCTILSSSFPAVLRNEISRDSVLNGIEDYFNSEINLVTLEGKQDIGKTRIVSQFAQRHNNSCISLFVRPNSWFLQDPALALVDLANQMHWASRRCEIPTTVEIDEAAVRRLSFEMQRIGRSTTGTSILQSMDLMNWPRSAAFYVVPWCLCYRWSTRVFDS